MSFGSWFIPFANYCVLASWAENQRNQSYDVKARAMGGGDNPGNSNREITDRWLAHPNEYGNQVGPLEMHADEEKSITPRKDEVWVYNDKSEKEKFVVQGLGYWHGDLSPSFVIYSGQALGMHRLLVMAFKNWNTHFTRYKPKPTVGATYYAKGNPALQATVHAILPAQGLGKSTMVVFCIVHSAEYAMLSVEDFMEYYNV